MPLDVFHFDIHSGKQFLPLLALLGVLLLCLIRTTIAWLLLKWEEHNLNYFTEEKKKWPFHLVSQVKGLSPVPRRAGTGKDLGYNTRRSFSYITSPQPQQCCARAQTGVQILFIHRGINKFQCPSAWFFRGAIHCRNRSTPFACSICWAGCNLHGIPGNAPHRAQGAACWQEKPATPSVRWVLSAEMLSSVHLQPALGRALPAAC